MTKVKKYLINPKDTPDDPLTWDRLMAWLVDTGWVDATIRKRISPLDQHIADDMLQETWLQILEVPKDKLLGIWYKGKGKFTNYIKSIIVNNLISNSSIVYNRTKGLYANELYISSDGWHKFEEAETDNSADVIYPIVTDQWCDNGRRLVEVGIDTIPIKSTEDLYVNDES